MIRVDGTSRRGLRSTSLRERNCNLEPQALPKQPSTPQKSSSEKDIGDILRRLSLSEVHIPYHGIDSPCKRTRSDENECLVRIRFLYFRQPERLKRIITEFETDVQRLDFVGSRIEALLSLLAEEAQQQKSVLEYRQDSHAIPLPSLYSKTCPETLIVRHKSALEQSALQQKRLSVPKNLRQKTIQESYSLKKVADVLNPGKKRKSADSVDECEPRAPGSADRILLGRSPKGQPTVAAGLPLQCSRNGSFGRTISDVTAGYDSLDDPGCNTSFGASTTAASFTTQPSSLEPPSSTFDGNVTDSQMLSFELDTTAHLGALDDEQNSIQHSLLTRASTKAPFSPTAQTGRIPEKDIHHLVRDLPVAPFTRCPLPEIAADVPFSSRWTDFLNAAVPGPHAMQKPVSGANISYRASLDFHTHGTNLVTLKPEPPSPDLSFRAQRLFGASRFLIVHYYEPGRTLHRDLSVGKDEFAEKFLQWQLSGKEFLGRTWKCFHHESLGRKAGSKENAHRIIFFATHGSDLETIPFRDFLNVMIPFRPNSALSFCKAWSRIALSLSRTKPTIKFTWQQIRFARPDILADETPESSLFNDPECQWHTDFRSADKSVMNDGCELISPAAARMICEYAGIRGILPVAFQGRINGAKGMWVISEPYEGASKEIWINLNRSQIKFHPDNPETADWTFELVRHSAPPKTSNLHVDFIPILENRGIKQEVLRTIVRDQVTLDFDTFLATLDDPAKVRSWLGKNYDSRMGRKGEDAIAATEGFPSDTFARTVHLLDAGFAPSSCSFLANSLQKVAGWYTDDMIQKMKIRLGKSTFVYAIPDPYSILGPGQIQMAFSQPFYDENSATSYPHLSGKVITARHPSLRPSDMQMVEAVYRKELAHLRDVIICSTKGSVPLASKLQGGDYDGDMFWLCWDERLTATFRNARVREVTMTVADMGIAVDRRTLGDVLGPQLTEVELLLREAFAFTQAESLLGTVTNYHKRLAYVRRSLSHEDVLAITEIHHLIIDATKNGCKFTTSDWHNFLESHKLPRELTTPAYEEFIADHKKFCREGKPLDRTWVLDSIVFDVIEPSISCFHKTLGKRLDVAKGLGDEDLETALKEATTRNKSDAEIKEVLEKLHKDVTKLGSDWSRQMNDSFSGSAWFRQKEVNAKMSQQDRTAFRLTCMRRFAGFRPCKPDNPVVKDWMVNYGERYTRWQRIKASMLFAVRSSIGRPDFAFIVAGLELCDMKAHSTCSRAVDAGIYQILKPEKLLKVMTRNDSGKFHSLTEDEAFDGDSLPDEEMELGARG